MKTRTLTADDVEHIRALYATGLWTQGELAELYRISQPHVCKLVHSPRGHLQVVPRRTPTPRTPTPRRRTQVDQSS